MPSVSGFKPYGENPDFESKECVYLLYEEYEALRLNDYEKHGQCEAAAIMQVSRPTFTRIYMNAREKIAKAFVEGLQIAVEGGKVELDGNWYVCGCCGAIFSNENGESAVCALCGSEDVSRYGLPETMKPAPETSEEPEPAECRRRRCCRGRKNRE